MSRDNLTTYLYMKGAQCRFDHCKYDGDCDKCEYGEIRKHAARDQDEIDHLRRIVREKGLQ